MNYLIKKQKEIKGQSKKGFTLVEVIVVIVIIAILAAMAVPALTGYIGKAKEKAAMADARQILTALQTISNDSYATGAIIYAGAAIDSKPRINGPYVPGWQSADSTYLQLINDLVGKTYKVSNFGNNKKVDFGPQNGSTGQGVDGAVNKFVYISDDNIEITYTKSDGFKRTK